MSTSYSIAAAHRITGKSRTTISKHIKDGKLSCTIAPDGSKQIDASELLRVYGDDLDFSIEEGGAKPVKSSTTAALEPANMSNDIWKDQVEREREERERERKLLLDQIEHLKEALDKALEGHNRATLMLEDQRGGSAEWKQRLRQIEEKLAQQERQSDEKLAAAKKEAEQLKKTLAESRRKKGFIRKLFG